MTIRPKEWRVICTRCLEENDARWVTPGSPLMEVLLYLATLPLLCAGGLMYTGFRSIYSHWACPACSSKEVVPVGSVRGRSVSDECGGTR